MVLSGGPKFLEVKPNVLNKRITFDRFAKKKKKKEDSREGRGYLNADHLSLRDGLNSAGVLLDLSRSFLWDTLEWKWIRSHIAVA